MKVEVHWPDCYEVDKVDLSVESNKFHSMLLSRLIQHSHDYDVIIDNGKVTFVDKE
jgi:hypothetical protein